MAGDAPLLERLAKLPALPAAEALGLLERLPQPQTDPVIGPLFGVDEDGDAAVNPLVRAVLKQFEDRTELTCYAALIEGLTGVWNAAVRAAVVARLRASGLPSDDLLLRLGALSPTLGFAAEKPELAREGLAGPVPQGPAPVPQCVDPVVVAPRAKAPPPRGRRGTRPQETGDQSVRIHARETHAE